MHGTPGQKKIPETALRDPMIIDPAAQDPKTLRTKLRGHGGDLLVNKEWFDVFTNPNVEPVLDELDPEHIFVYGVALDVCNRYAIEGLLARRPQARVLAVTDAMKPIDPSHAEALLAGWGRRGVTLVTTDETLAYD
jgi:nicotinamidase-related amidase